MMTKKTHPARGKEKEKNAIKKNKKGFGDVVWAGGGGHILHISHILPYYYSMRLHF